MATAMAQSVASLVFRDTNAHLGDSDETNIQLYSYEEFLAGRKTDTRKSTHCMLLDSPHISKNHFRIYTIQYEDTDGIDSIYYCEDLESINGTYVNDILIGKRGKPSSPYLLSDGDIITVRPGFNFEFKQPLELQREKMDKVQQQDIASFADRYSITDRLLGSGIYGKVYLAADLATKKQLACKIVDLPTASSLSMDPNNGPISILQEQALEEERERLIREVELLTKLNHPNIVSLRKTFRSENSVYLFMELAPGGDLCSFLSANGGYLTDLHTRVIVRQITIAIQYLHSVGVVHRDIKPENILLMNTAVGHRVILADFGCAASPQSEGRMYSMVGTYDYVAPEIRRSEGNRSREYTRAVDMWSLGIVTLCLLTGKALATFEEMNKFSQSDIRARVNQPRSDFEGYSHWQTVSDRAKNFLTRLLILEPSRRMTAEQAVKHDWFHHPSTVARELGRLYRRSIQDWSPRRTDHSVIETIPGVHQVGNLATPQQYQSQPSSRSARRQSRKWQEATLSRHFNLDKYTRAHTPARETTQRCRQRIINTLRESGKLFVDGADVSSYTPPKSRRTVNVEFREVQATNLFGAATVECTTPRCESEVSRQFEFENSSDTTECSTYELPQRTCFNRNKRFLEQTDITGEYLGCNLAGPTQVDPSETQLEQPSFLSEESSMLSNIIENEWKGRKRRRVAKSSSMSPFWFEDLKEIGDNKKMDEEEELPMRPDSHIDSSLLVDETNTENQSSTTI